MKRYAVRMVYIFENVMADTEGEATEIIGLELDAGKLRQPDDIDWEAYEPEV